MKYWSLWIFKIFKKQIIFRHKCMFQLLFSNKVHFFTTLFNSSRAQTVTHSWFVEGFICEWFKKWFQLPFNRAMNSAYILFKINFYCKKFGSETKTVNATFKHKMCAWRNRYRRRKWTQVENEFVYSHFAPLVKIWIHFFLPLAELPWYSNHFRRKTLNSNQLNSV